MKSFFCCYCGRCRIYTVNQAGINSLQVTHSHACVVKVRLKSYDFLTQVIQTTQRVTRVRTSRQTPPVNLRMFRRHEPMVLREERCARRTPYRCDALQAAGRGDAPLYFAAAAAGEFLRMRSSSAKLSSTQLAFKIKHRRRSFLGTEKGPALEFF